MFAEDGSGNLKDPDVLKAELKALGLRDGMKIAAYCTGMMHSIFTQLFCWKRRCPWITCLSNSFQSYKILHKMLFNTDWKIPSPVAVLWATDKGMI